MIPKIIKPRKEDLIWNKKVKWVVVSKYECMNYDLCDSFGDAIRFWLWHCGVPPKIAFGWFSKYKQSEDEEDV
jgi:hypothetical protein